MSVIKIQECTPKVESVKAVQMPEDLGEVLQVFQWLVETFPNDEFRVSAQQIPEPVYISHSKFCDIYPGDWIVIDHEGFQFCDDEFFKNEYCIVSN